MRHPSRPLPRIAHTEEVHHPRHLLLQAPEVLAEPRHHPRDRPRRLRPERPRDRRIGPRHQRRIVGDARDRLRIVPHGHPHPGPLERREFPLQRRAHARAGGRLRDGECRGRSPNNPDASARDPLPTHRDRSILDLSGSRCALRCHGRCASSRQARQRTLPSVVSSPAPPTRMPARVDDGDDAHAPGVGVKVDAERKPRHECAPSRLVDLRERLGPPLHFSENDRQRIKKTRRNSG